ncbi:magnesium transporter CorA family protein [Guggenheimella bovis]
MIRIFQSEKDELLERYTPVEKAWISLINPTEEEMNTVSQFYHVPMDHLRAAMDVEERSRSESEDGITLIIVDAAIEEPEEDYLSYWTLPFAIILVDENIITVCSRDIPLIDDFVRQRVRNFFSYKRSRFVLQLLYKNATYYLNYLKKIDRMSNVIERELHRSMRNEELIQLLELEKSLVYFSTSLTANELVLEKLLKLESFKRYPEDEDLLEDVIIENKQAIEMANIYTNILSGTMDAFASIISNNLNIVMKTLAIITIILSIPTLVFSFFGMNVNLPFENNPFAVVLVLLLTVLLTFVTYLFLKKDKRLR